MAESKKPSENSEEPAEISADLPLPESAKESKKDEPKKGTAKDAQPGGRWQRFRAWYTGHKKLSVPLSIVVVLLLIFAIPLLRYGILGTVVKKNFVVQVNDSTTNTPVSGASVSAGSISVLTDGNGKANIRLSVGHHSLSISKKYYKDRRADITVPILGEKKIPVVTAEATGRQVKITVKNVVSKKLLQNVDIKVLDITAKTDKDGKALIVLPAGQVSQKATISLSGYNSAEVTLKVSDSSVAENDFTLTPAGKIYFLSKLSGKIDVVKSNLDGTSRETVLAGIGKEENQNTVLLASRDWKYLALLSRRDSDQAKLYLIETASDKVTAIDEGNATFNLIGWSDSNFVYQVDRLGYQQWQPKAHALKSYDAQAKKINLLDETDAQGTNNFDYNAENFDSVYVIGQRVVYSKSWYPNYSGLGDNNKLGIYSINSSGAGGRSTNKLFGYAPAESTYQQSFLHSPDEIYFQVVEKSADAKYYVYSSGQVSEKSSIKDDFQNYLDGSQYNTYLASPSGSQTFWSESRDGKNSLFIGDNIGSNGKQIATLSDYQTYGWFSDDYLLVSKNGSELYIFTSGEIKKDTDALKVTDYHKPVVNYPGYGGGYGGI